MKKFKALIKCLQNRGCVMPEQDGKTIRRLNISHSELEAIIKDCRCFIFEPTNDEPLNTESIEIQEIDAPFKLFSIEYTGDTFITIPRPHEPDVKIDCMIVSEIGPKEYRIFKHIIMCGVEEVMLMANDVVSTNLLKPILDRLRVESVGMQQVEEVVMIKKEGTKKNKKKAITKNHVFIVSKSKSSKINSSKSEIDWSHQWEVRGHWKRVKGVGKNREGEYCVQGWSWWKAHKKGPEGKPLIKKQRIVTGEN